MLLSLLAHIFYEIVFLERDQKSFSSVRNTLYKKTGFDSLEVIDSCYLTM